MNNHGVATIGCQVSTHDQRELSLDSQELAVLRNSLRSLPGVRW